MFRILVMMTVTTGKILTSKHSTARREEDQKKERGEKKITSEV